MGRAGRCSKAVIKPANGLLQAAEGFFRLIFEQIYQSGGGLLLRPYFAVAIEAMPVVGLNGKARRDRLSQF